MYSGNQKLVFFIWNTVVYRYTYVYGFVWLNTLEVKKLGKLQSLIRPWVAKMKNSYKNCLKRAKRIFEEKCEITLVMEAVRSPVYGSETQDQRYQAAQSSLQLFMPISERPWALTTWSQLKCRTTYYTTHAGCPQTLSRSRPYRMLLRWLRW